MPNNTEKLSKSKSKGRKAVKEQRYRKIALSDDSATYGRVIKALGQRQFRVILPDASSRLIEVRATIPKKRSLIGVDDIVVVATSGSVYEIQATMDRKTAHTLGKQKKLHPDLLLTGEQFVAKEDLGIDFDYEGLEVVEEQEDESEDEKENKEEINIDDI
jgi:translation initiation factor IF-1